MSELTLDDLVVRLGKSVDWWKREINAGGHDHLRIGRDIRLTEDQYVALRDTFVVRAEYAITKADPLQSQTSRSRNHGGH
ncbi:hypothetical protein [Isoptericola sp. NPDC056134]|uniref:hypothetical protein n=1 Tax=Isoptericola sp. NPDC056134 TaxID=3345723 RepID=UPI0035EE9470